MLLSEIATRLGLEHIGPDREILGVNTLESAAESELSFLVNPKYVKALESTNAGAVLLSSEHAPLVESALLSNNVYMDLARVVSLFAKSQGDFAGHSPLAFIHETASVHEDATVYPFAFVGSKAVVGADSVVFPGCYVGERSSVGEGCLLYPNAVLMADTTLGDRCILQPGAVLGGDGFGFAQTPVGHMKIPQIGRVDLGDDVEVGANSSIDRAALDLTQVGSGTKVDSLVQIGHNVRIGEHCLVVAGSGIGGSTRIGDGVVIGGQAGIKDNITIGDGCMIGAQSGVNNDLSAGSKVTYTPMMEIGTYLRVGASLPRLPDLLKRVRRLEREIEQLRTTENGENNG
ncbi:UDP-3-O-[3-hydroxymyristoyl] glucosamine N-acyltransferase [Paucidesulfovibrio gracilis DSM 16080]|uniref:UDP-3-O-acylglucosamine N-acyltransferase n=1 Tax=Paucidesulfovibrio gracilis DSM 16080 TaxID=1121449 RepID=A0A1T4WJL3_9BACT|nr:UDP-3-O-(3-hydroxymyristoyl)glucosamine N-acyltransferase [Paucidesulfovibrio gracilis]SKA77524.1 UDP-3-O-[3-hydroxymyristoyl] glucosamine N-acyltransferase [Paucidesulfovibrio gracilis DSM 16080]